jgi:hypothetical protein
MTLGSLMGGLRDQAEADARPVHAAIRNAPPPARRTRSGRQVFCRTHCYVDVSPIHRRNGRNFREGCFLRLGLVEHSNHTHVQDASCFIVVGIYMMLAISISRQCELDGSRRAGTLELVVNRRQMEREGAEMKLSEATWLVCCATRLRKLPSLIGC